MPFVRPFFSWSGGCAFAAVVGYFIVVAAISSSRVRSSSFLSRGAVVRRRPGCVEVDRGARSASVRPVSDGVEDVIGIDRVEYGWELYAPDAATARQPLCLAAAGQHRGTEGPTAGAGHHRGTIRCATKAKPMHASSKRLALR